jgi:hypothetical protein
MTSHGAASDAGEMKGKVGSTMANSSSTARLPHERGLGAMAGSAPATRVKTAPEYDLVRFSLRPNPKFLRCLALYPDDPARRPAVRAMIVPGSLEDELFLVGRYIKPNLQLEMFTIEHSQLLTDGVVDPSFRNFGLAWYHTSLQVNENGVLSAHVRAVLLDQFFGLDTRLRLSPIGTFHIGLWFSDPADAAASGFDVNKPAPFSSKERGGPLAMTSVPVAGTGLGPLCTRPSMWLTFANALS